MKRSNSISRAGRFIKGTAEAARKHDLGDTGVVWVRNVDPLKGISSLTHKQREAGQRYRADLELAAREGLKSTSTDIQVDGGSISAPVAARLIDNHTLSGLSLDRRRSGCCLRAGNVDPGNGRERERVVRDIPRSASAHGP